MSWAQKVSGNASHASSKSNSSNNNNNTTHPSLQDQPSLPTTTGASNSNSSAHKNAGSNNQQPKLSKAWANNKIGKPAPASQQQQQPSLVNSNSNDDDANAIKTENTNNNKSRSSKNNNNNRNNNNKASVAQEASPSSNNDNNNVSNITQLPQPKSSSSNNNNNSNANNIDFYVVLDFEATCQKTGRPAHQEIIEFPSVLVDAERCAVVSQFQRYVRPIHGEVSEFCTNLTGIPPAVVAEANTFAVVWQEYQQWLKSCGLFVEGASSRVAWVTCGDWDLKTMLPNQLKNPRPSRDDEPEDAKCSLPQRAPPMLQRWVNLKNVYQQVVNADPSYGKKRIGSMHDMCEYSKVLPTGHHHSGIDDCRNIASCLIALLRKKIPVGITYGSFDEKETSWQTQRPSDYPTQIVAADLHKLSAKATAALDRAREQSQKVQELEEAAKKGRSTTASSQIVDEQTGAGTRRKRGFPDANGAENNNNNNNNAAAAAASSNNNASAPASKATTAAASSRPTNDNNNNNNNGTYIVTSSQPVEIDKTRDVCQELFTAARIDVKKQSADQINNVLFRQGGAVAAKRVSHSLSNALRHNAQQWGIPMSLNGFVKVDDLVRNNRFHNITPLQLAAQVSLSDKQRFAMFYGSTPNTRNTLFIRANQGHSIENIVVDMDQITDPKQCPIAVHGTTNVAWNSIRKQGLSRMQRQHMHFAKGLPGQNGVISGMRGSSDVLIYLDVAKVLKDGIALFQSSNGVILTAGVDGMLSPEYFSKVVDRKTGKEIN